MAAPTPVTAGTPSGVKLRDGFSTRFTHSLIPTVAMWVKSLTPSGLDGGDPVEQKTMHNIRWAPVAPQTLIKSGPITYKVAYDPYVWVSVPPVINKEGIGTILFSDTSTVSYFSYIQKFDPGECVDGTQPDGTMTVICTNWDPVNSVEAGPFVVAAAGS